MRKILALVTAAVLLGGAFAVLYLNQPPVRHGPPDTGAGRAGEGSATGERTPVHPPIRYPITDEQGHTRDADTQSARPLPSLDKSDGPLRNALKALFGDKALNDLFRTTNVIQRVVVTLDNVTGRQLPLRYLPVKPVGGSFRVAQTRGRLFLSQSNYRRYTPYVRIAEAVDTDALVKLYVRYYPLFQKVYENLGYKGYFNDRLVAVLQTLLDTPQVRGPIKLIQPSVYYKFADPHLESLTAGQKILIRMGPGNARRVKAKLRSLRRALMSLDARRPSSR